MRIRRENLDGRVKEKGADLFGIASLERLSSLPGVEELRRILPPDASTIIVLGLSISDVSIERAGEPPAESAVSYSFLRYILLLAFVFYSYHRFFCLSISLIFYPLVI